MSEIPTREAVARAIVRAATLEDLDEARQLRDVYLQHHPDDSDILEMGTALDALADALKPTEPHDGVPTNKK